MLFFTALSGAWADTIRMKNGSTIEGLVISENSSEVVVNIGYGTVTLKKKNILRIRRSTKKQRKTTAKEMRRRQFESGSLVPKGAAKLSGLYRDIKFRRDKTFEEKNRRTDLKKEAREIENDLSSLKENYRSLSEELRATDQQSNPQDYNDTVSELNKISARIQAQTFRLEELRSEAGNPGSGTQAYLDAYHKIDAHIRNEGKQLLAANPNGLYAEYYGWVRDEVRKMKNDFTRDSIESDVQGNRIIVKAVINGRVTARLLVDSGATTTVLYKRVADALKLKPQDVVRISQATVADGRKISTKEVRLKSITIGKSRVNNTPASIMPVSSDEMDGLLGMSFLRHFVMRVDSANGRLILESLKQ
ncbi:MAG: aspartyl protease family protein [bacterium]